MPVIWDWVFALISFHSIPNFEIGIILIFKLAATLCLSGIPAELALTQAESDYQKANIDLKIEEHFPGTYQEYSAEQLIGFLMSTTIGLSSFTSIKIIADTAFRAV